MRREGLPWLSAGAAAAVFGTLIAFSSSWGSMALISVLGLLLFWAVSLRMRTEQDAAWLPKAMMFGFAAKLVGTYARYYMVAVLYGGGDSYRYYRVGTDLAAQIRDGRLPQLTEQGAFGTQVTEYITGVLFSIFTPDMLGGFLIFSMFAFGGQVLLYAGFRHWAKPTQLKTYALLMFFLPTYSFWPSSIGKDAIVVFALGGAAYFMSRVLRAFEIRWLIGLAAFLGFLGLIRIHVAGLVVAGLIGAGLVARMPPDTQGVAPVRRLVILAGFLAAGGLVWTLFPNVFGVDITGADSLDAFASDVVRRTSESGTVASGGPVSGPADIPGAIALALFRPFPFEATELQHFFAAGETTLLLGLTIWKLPAMLRNWRSWRANGYVVFSTFYVIGFSVAFSVVRNLGIIARQRGQVLAFFLCVLIALGWDDSEGGSSRPVRAGTPSSRLQREWRHRHPTRVR